MDQEKSLTLRPSAWLPSHAAQLARAVICDPMMSAESLRLDVEAGRSQLFDVIETETGEVLGCIVLRVEQRELGAEGVIDAAAGRLPFARSRLPALVRALESKFYGVKFYRIHSARRSVIRSFMRLGYAPRGMVLARAAA